MPKEEFTTNQQSVETQAWGESLEDFVTRLFIKYTKKPSPFLASFNRVQFLFDGSKSPDELTQLIKDQLRSLSAD